MTDPKRRPVSLTTRNQSYKIFQSFCVKIEHIPALGKHPSLLQIHGNNFIILIYRAAPDIPSWTTLPRAARVGTKSLTTHDAHPSTSGKHLHSPMHSPQANAPALPLACQWQKANAAALPFRQSEWQMSAQKSKTDDLAQNQLFQKCLQKNLK